MPNNISAGDTAWLLASAALVMLMTPALGFFYGGLVRRKNVLATIMHSFFILALISVQWVLWGYTLAFGPDHGGLIGGLDWLALRGVGQDPGPYAPTVPHEAYMVFQMMFAVITPALITGAFAERKRFKAFVVFTLLWATFVYDPVAHWVWGGGWLGQLGALDFAGGTVVHITSGVSALVAALVLRRRDVFGVHGVGGAWGALATGIFATVAINSGAKDGLAYGNPGQLGIQAIAVAASIVYSAVMTFVILKLIDVFVGLRVPENEEVLGLDASQHREAAYQI